MSQNITNKEILLELMKEVKTQGKQLAIFGEDLGHIKQQTSKTNGSVARVMQDILDMDEKIEDGDRENDKKALKYVIAGMVIGAFVFIKESRDLILHYLGLQ